MDKEVRNKLIENAIMNTARIAAIERFVQDLATRALGDSPETAAYCKRINKYFHQSLAKIKKESGFRDIER
jgi:hypothetical protein